MMLLEGLIAIFIFSLGILAIVGMQAVATKQVTDARYRSEAALLVDDLFGMMWTSDRDPLQLKAKFESPAVTQSASAGASGGGSGGPGYQAWLQKVQATLPGTASNPPVVTLDDGTAKVTIQWLAPGEDSGGNPHQYFATTKIR